VVRTVGWAVVDGRADGSARLAGPWVQPVTTAIAITVSTATSLRTARR
jgi:hypothetical protein